MAHGEFVADSGSYSKNGVVLADGLPSIMPNDPSSGNFKVLDAIGRAIDRLEDDIRDVDEDSTVQTANTISSLEELARMVAIRAKGGESKEKFRTRTLANYQLVTCEGSVNNIITNAATLLNLKPTEIGYDSFPEEPGAEYLIIPKSAVDALELTEAEFVQIVNAQVPFGYRVDAKFQGTFTYRTESDYINLVNDSTKGYTDEAGTVDGGTYAGLLTT